MCTFKKKFITTVGIVKTGVYRPISSFSDWDESGGVDTSGGLPWEMDKI